MKNRLKEIVDEFGNGKNATFARLIDIPRATFQRYVDKGEINKTEHLIKISDELEINIHWLVTGDGPKYLDETHGEEFEYEIVNNVRDWLYEMIEEDHRFEHWFSYELGKRFPEYLEWWNNKKGNVR